jgi:hypothetical protein
MREPTVTTTATSAWPHTGLAGLAGCHDDVTVRRLDRTPHGLHDVTRSAGLVEVLAQRLECECARHLPCLGTADAVRYREQDAATPNVETRAT